MVISAFRSGSNSIEVCNSWVPTSFYFKKIMKSKYSKCVFSFEFVSNHTVLMSWESCGRSSLRKQNPEGFRNQTNLSP